MEKIIIIAGATASGKTSVAVEVAKRINGEVICMDSMQIYKGMDIGTAKVTKQEMSGILHHMIDVVDWQNSFSVAEYSAQSKLLISQIIAKGCVPIFCGGTGLYIDSIIYPYEFGNNVQDNSVREKLIKELEELGARELHNRLTLLDPEDAQKIHPNNTKRLLRALEIIETSGISKSQFANKTLLYDLQLYALNWDREVLYQRINHRVDLMFEKGLLDEVTKLYNNDFANFDYQSMQAIGYKEFKDFFLGNITLSDVKNSIAQSSRRYAKRQLTWLRKYSFTNWISPENAIDTIVDNYNNSNN